MKILFIDDEIEELPAKLRSYGYPETILWKEFTSFDDVLKGGFQILFLDVRGVLPDPADGNGLSILQGLKKVAPNLYIVIFSAKPFEPSETRIVHEFADAVLEKGTAIFKVLEVIEEAKATISRRTNGVAPPAAVPAAPWYSQ